MSRAKSSYSKFVPFPLAEHSQTAPQQQTEKNPDTPTPTSSGASQLTFPESDVQELMQIGFSREDVTAELQRQGGNKTQAIAALFAKSFKVKH